MNIAAIGIGGAGGRVVDVLAAEHGTGQHSPLAAVHVIDTDTESLQRLDAVPQAARHGIGQFETGADGTDGDRTLAGEIIEAEKNSRLECTLSRRLRRACRRREHAAYRRVSCAKQRMKGR